MKSILAVDDEHDILLVVDLILTEAGYTVIKAANGKEALARLAETRPVAVLMDIMMPVMSGLDTLKAIRADTGYADIPVVLMSALQPRVSRQEYRWDAFLRKPFEIDELLNTITNLVEKE